MTAVADDRERHAAASLAGARAPQGRLVVSLERHTLCLFADGERGVRGRQPLPAHGLPAPPRHGLRRDPHLPLAPRALRPGTGGTFDQFADELRRFPVEVADGDDVLVDLTPPRRSGRATSASGCGYGLERDIPLVAREGDDRAARGRPERGRRLPRRARLRRRAARRRLVPRPDDAHLPDEPRAAARRPSERAAALYHGLADVASDSAGRTAALPARAAARRRGRARAARALVPPLRRGARRRGRRARARLGRPRGRVAARARRHALRGRDRPPLPRRRPHARLRQQGARGARPRRLGARRGGARLAAGTARLRRADGGGERLAQPGRPGRAARGRVRAPAGGARRRRAAAAGTAAPALVEAMLSTARRPRSSTRCSRRCATARPRSSSPRRSRSPRRRGSPASRRATSSATGTPRCTRSPSRTPSSRACAARRRPSSLRGVLDAAMSVYLDRFLNVPAARLPRAAGARRPRRRCSTSCRSLLDRPAAGRRGRAARRLVPRRRRRPAAAGRRARRRACCARTATSTRSSASRRPSASTSSDRRRAAAAARGGALPRRARDDDALAAADLRDRAPPAPRREALRGRAVAGLGGRARSAP